MFTSVTSPDLSVSICQTDAVSPKKHNIYLIISSLKLCVLHPAQISTWKPVENLEQVKELDEIRRERRTAGINLLNCFYNKLATNIIEVHIFMSTDTPQASPSIHVWSDIKIHTQ